MHHSGFWTGQRRLTSVSRLIECRQATLFAQSISRLAIEQLMHALARSYQDYFPLADSNDGVVAMLQTDNPRKQPIWTEDQ